jgi:hypothetical protein
MKFNIRTGLCPVLLAILAVFAFRTNAQQAQARIHANSLGNSAYDITREIVLDGTVLKYTENSTVPPLGAHIMMQTASGLIDVHIGDARFLKLNKFTITEGSTIRIVGQSLPYGNGSMFFARVIQQGNQSLSVRSTKGMPLWPAGARVQTSQEHALQKEGAR